VLPGRPQKRDSRLKKKEVPIAKEGEERDSYEDSRSVGGNHLYSIGKGAVVMKLRETISGGPTHRGDVKHNLQLKIRGHMHILFDCEGF